MAPASNEEQFKFLISCIRYSNNGKVDFTQVAKECKIVSKGAAAKRYERMMRAHGIASNAATVRPSLSRNLKAERNEALPPSSSSSTSVPISKKRKADPSLDEVNAGDDDEGFGTSAVKVEPAIVGREQHFVVKEEERNQRRCQPGQLSLDDAANLIRYYDTPTGYAGMSMGMGTGMGVDEGYDGYNGEYLNPTPTPSYEGGMPGQPGPSTGGSSLGTMYEMGSQQPYGFPSHSSYGSAGVGGMQSVELEPQRMSYRPLIQYSTDGQGQGQGQGQSDSPVIVE